MTSSKNIVYLVFDTKFYTNENLFNLSHPNNRDNSWLVYSVLRKKLKENGYLLRVYEGDIDILSRSPLVDDFGSIYLYFDMPNYLPANKNNSYLILLESEVIKPENWILNKHHFFKKVFTWNDSFVDNVKYFKINFSSNLPSFINKDISQKSKLCTLIAGNKEVNHSLELYSKRVEAIRWFENNHPLDFDLYGIGWDRYVFYGFFGILNKINMLTDLLAPLFPSYRGAVVEKKTVLEKYKFSICYENAKNITGYITEKIFDSFIAGCVPIYWGADNITQHIPKNCFIDKREFDSYESLYLFIKNMSDEKYLEYLENIQVFLGSDDIKQFSSEYFAATISETILSDQN